VMALVSLAGPDQRVSENGGVGTELEDKRAMRKTKMTMGSR